MLVLVLCCSGMLVLVVGRVEPDRQLQTVVELLPYPAVSVLLLQVPQ